MKTTVDVACGQIRSVLNDKKANIAKMQDYVRRIKTEYPKTELIVFPELALTGYECDKQEMEQLAEPFEGSESILEMGKCAKEFGTHLIFGFPERGEQDEIYNSAVLIDDSGTPLGAYQKIQLVEEEKEIFTGGNTLPVFDTSIGKIAIMICWDAAFPEIARLLALKGADMIAMPAAWEVPNHKDWDLVNKARAFDNVIYILSCNQVGKERTLDFFGRGRIVSPLGDYLTNAVDNEECIIAGTIDLATMKDLREGYYAQFVDCRRDFYVDS